MFRLGWASTINLFSNNHLCYTDKVATTQWQCCTYSPLPGRYNHHVGCTGHVQKWDTGLCSIYMKGKEIRKGYFPSVSRLFSTFIYAHTVAVTHAWCEWSMLTTSRRAISWITFMARYTSVLVVYLHPKFINFRLSVDLGKHSARGLVMQDTAHSTLLIHCG